MLKQNTKLVQISDKLSNSKCLHLKDLCEENVYEINKLFDYQIIRVAMYRYIFNIIGTIY